MTVITGIATSDPYPSDEVPTHTHPYPQAKIPDFFASTTPTMPTVARTPAASAVHSAVPTRRHTSVSGGPKIIGHRTAYDGHSFELLVAWPGSPMAPAFELADDISKAGTRAEAAVAGYLEGLSKQEIPGKLPRSETARATHRDCCRCQRRGRVQYY